MSETVARMIAQLGELTEPERAALAYAALLTLEPEDPDVETAWDEELVRRADRIRRGEAVGIPAEEVFAAWRRGS
jgi:hypothetical protein